MSMHTTRLLLLLAVCAHPIQGQTYCASGVCESYTNNACCQRCLNTGEDLRYCNFDVTSVLVYENGNTGAAVGGCQICPENWYRNSDCNCNQCSRCLYRSTNLGEDVYFTTPCTGDNDGVCGPCRSRCEAGTYESHGCGTPNVNRDRECTACLAGTFRNDLNTQTCTACRACSTALRERRTKCGPIYDSTCVACEQGQIVTASVTGGDKDTCTTCNSGSYPKSFARASDNTCVGCRDCLRSQGEVTPCTSTADRTCTNCAVNERSSGLNAKCDGCVGGYVRGAAGCIPYEQAGCGDNQYIKAVTSVDLMGSRDCVFCQGHGSSSSLQCNPGYGVSTFCKGTGTEAVTCAQCAAGMERPAGTALVPDGTVSIQKCVPCATGKYKVGVGSGDCLSCGNKPDNSEYTAWSTTVAGTSACPWSVFFFLVVL